MTRRVIVLPNGKSVGLGVYCSSWRILKTVRPGKHVHGWEWYPVPAYRILASIRAAIHDRINQRGGLVVRECSERRLLIMMQRHLISHCNWCGQSLGQYAPKHARFCDHSCRQSYFG